MTLTKCSFSPIALFVATAAVLGACGNSGSSNGGGGVDTSGYCAQFSDYATQCGKNDACTQAEISQCSTYAAQFSGAYLSAAASCIKPPYDCRDGGSPTANQCFAQALAGITPTPTQQKVRADFCAQCPDGADKANPSACSQFFAVMTDDAGKTSAPGLVVLYAGDALAQQIDTKCTGGAPQQDAGIFGCASSFELCAALTLGFASNTPQACNHSGGQSVHLPLSGQ